MRQLNPGAFNRFIAGIGQDVEWRRAYACPCVNPNSGAANPRCPLCHGKGRTWGDGVACRLAMSGRDGQRQWAQLGQVEMGDTVVILPSDSPAYGMGLFDRVLMLNRTEPFSLNIVRGVNELLRFAVVSLERAFYIEGNVAVDLPLPAITPAGKLEWGAVAPPAGVTYSITGRKRAEYFVFEDLTFDRPHHAGQPLPRRVVMRRFDLFGR